MELNFLYQEILWGVIVWRFALAVLIIFIGFASRRVIQHLFRGYLTRKVRGTQARWDDELIELAPAPLALVVQIFIWYLAALLLMLPREPVDVQDLVYQVLEIALAVSLTWLILRLIDVGANALARASAHTESKFDDQIIPLFRKTLKVVIVITIGIMIIQNMGYSVTSMIAGLGVGGLAIALAAKDTVANVFGSVVVFTDRPFHVGDWVEFSGIEGTVEEVGFRTTRIRRFDKSQVTVPNATFSSNAITNHSRRHIRRISMTVGVSYETNSGQMRQLLEDIRTLVAEHDAIDQGFHFVHFVAFGASSLDIQIYCFTKSTVWTEFLAAREDLMLKIMDRIAARGLEIAYPTRTVYLRDEKWDPTAELNA